EERAAVFVEISWKCGSRFGETAALRPSDIANSPSRVVRITRSVREVNGFLDIKETKNHRRRETVFPRSIEESVMGLCDRVTRAGGADALLFPGVSPDA